MRNRKQYYRRQIINHLSKVDKRLGPQIIPSGITADEMGVRLMVVRALERRIMTMKEMDFRQIADLGFAVGVRFVPQFVPLEPRDA